ncbi:MAG: YigZ family protein [Bacteroidetes bacterium]|mgnify:CR=1 FL=1|uniref:YigZ family protein n=1 Tax=Candidatus Cryptobacteroides gallistercoris TaxID=2840765 RepID=A0A940IFP9_9BACT|nr:YigZ family protein [Candidatus Cryptobacteroides gallistercoris]
MNGPDNIIKDTYSSIASPSEGLFKDNGSRFIARAYPVETEEEIKEVIASLKKEYHDARHHCYAWRLGCGGERFRANDDGEPSGSAGRQILGQIDSRGLSDILIVVIRYFGGIKLGIPGLIRAYRTSAADALDKAATTEKTASKRFRLTFGYMSMNGVMKMAKDLGLAPEGQDFGMECTMEVNVRLSLEKEFLKRAADIEGCTASEP